MPGAGVVAYATAPNGSDDGTLGAPFVLKPDGTVVYWGNTAGTPVTTVTGATSVAAVSARYGTGPGGHDGAMFLLSDGSGLNFNASTGAVTTKDTIVSGSTPALANAVALYAGSIEIALLADGSLALTDYPNDGFSTLSNCTPPALTGVIGAASCPGLSIGAAVHDDGTVTTWGPDGNARKMVPPWTVVNPDGLSIGADHMLALNSDGTVSAWGDNTYGQCTVPSGLTSVTAVVAGWKYSVARKSDGTVVTWGFGTDSGGDLEVPSGLSGVTAIAASDTGPGFILALKSDTTVVAWGDNTDGQCTVPSGLTGVTDICARGAHALALKDDGTVVAWGDDGEGQSTIPSGEPDPSTPIGIGAGAYANRTLIVATDHTLTQYGSNVAGELAVPSGLDDVAEVVAGLYHTVVRKTDGTVTCFGNDGNGQSTTPAGLTGVTKINAGAQMSAAVTPTKVYWWGNMFYVSPPSSPISLTGVLGVACGHYGIAVVKSDGTVQTWGDSSTGQRSVPAGLSGVTALDGSDTFYLALKSDGTVVAWGDNTSGQCDVPAGLSGVTAIAAGDSHALALKEDGTVVAWGKNTFGQCDIPAGLADVTAIAAGKNHSVAMQSGGVFAWGNNNAGQTDVPESSLPSEALGACTAIAAGASISMGLQEDGTAVAWGAKSARIADATAIAAGDMSGIALKSDGTVAAFGIVYIESGNEPLTVPAGLADVVAIAGVASKFAARTSDGVVAIFGTENDPTAPLVWDDASNANGTADGYTDMWLGTYALALQQPDGRVYAQGLGVRAGTATPPPGLSDIKQVVLLNGQGLALQEDGTVVKWGKRGGTADLEPPDGLSGVTAIAASETHALAMKADGTVVGWGSGSAAAVPSDLGPAAAIHTANSVSMVLQRDRTVVGWGGAWRPPYSEGDYSFDALLLTGKHMLARTTDGRRVAWGAGDNWMAPRAWPTDVVRLLASDYHVMAVNRDGTLAEWAINNFSTSDDYVSAAALTGTTATELAVGPFVSIGVNSAGRVVQWGPDADTAPPPDDLQLVEHVASGRGHHMAQLSTGAVVVWGDNSFDQVTNAYTGTNAVDVAAGTFHCLALLGDGTVVAWGRNVDGECNVPAGLTGVAKLYAAVNASNQGAARPHAAVSLALKADGTVVAWGKNDKGQCNVPAGLTGVVALSAFEDHCLAVKADGTVVQWGDSSLAQPPEGLTDVTAAVAFDDGGIAAKSDGTLVMWGADPRMPQAVIGAVTQASDGLGVYVVTDQHVLSGWGKHTNAGGYNVLPPPYALGACSAVTASRGGDFVVALKTDTTVAAWGDTTSNQCAIPESLTGVSAVAVGYHHTLALKEDGTLVAWGNNADGECTVPAGLSGVVAIAASGKTVNDGGGFSVALKEDGTVVAWGNNDYQQTAVPAGLTGVQAISAGTNHVLALKDDGTVVAWGDDRADQATVPAGLSAVSAVVAVGTRSVALKDDGTVSEWDSGSTVPAGLSGVTQVMASDTNVAALTDAHSIVVWGQGFDGQTTIPTDIAPLTVLGAQVGNYGSASFPVPETTGSASNDGPAVYDITLADSLGLGASHASVPTWVWRARLGLSDAPSTLLDGLQVHTDGLGFADIATAVLHLVMSDTLGFTATPKQAAQLAAQYADAIALAAGPGHLLDGLQVVTEALALADTAGVAWPMVLSDSMGLSAEHATRLDGIARMLDTLALSDTPEGTASMVVLVSDTLALSDLPSTAAELLVALTDTMGLLATFHVPEGTFVAWVFNGDTQAYTRYSNYPFNSFCELDGIYYGATDTGLYRLDGDDDAGEPIEARVRTGLTDMGTGRLKRTEALYLGLRASGDMVLKVVTTTDGGEKTESWYSVESRPADAVRETRAKVGRGLKSVYWGAELANVDGADFELASIAWLPLLLERRID